MNDSRFTNSFIGLCLSVLVSACTQPAQTNNSQIEINPQGNISALTTQFQLSPSETIRLGALNQLATLDPPATIQLLSKTLPQIDSWPLLTRACELAVQFNNPILIDPLIQSLARPATTFTRRQRPGALALEHLGHQKLETILQSRLLTSPKIPARVAAMDLLAELQSPAQVMQFISQIAPGLPGEGETPGLSPKRTPLKISDDFLLSLQWWTKTFGNLPNGLQESAWVLRLYASSNEPWLLRAITRHQQLRTESDYLIAPCFIALLANVNESYLPLTRPQLLADIQQKLTPHKSAHRPPSYTGAPDDYQPTLAAQQKNLSRCDLLALEILLDSLSSPAFTHEILTLGNADRLDPTTEHGGLLQFVMPTPPSALNAATSLPKTTPNPPALSPKIYPPIYANRDTAYISSDTLLADTPLALAQFHFHFQQPQNESNAGPGRGDLDYIHQTPCNAVVFTSITPNSFDTTYYTPTGAILDLGIRQTETP